MNSPEVNKPVWDPELALCSYTPRFSYRCPKLAVHGVAQGCSTGVHAVREGPGGADWVGTRVGIPGYYQAPTDQGPEHAKRRQVQRSGPRNPLQGGGVGGTCCSAPRARPPSPHPSGPVGPALQALPGAGWALHRLLANKGEINVKTSEI